MRRRRGAAQAVPSRVIVFRCMDEYDTDIDTLVRSVERIRFSCP